MWLLLATRYLLVCKVLQLCMCKVYWNDKLKLYFLTNKIHWHSSLSFWSVTVTCSAQKIDGCEVGLIEVCSQYSSVYSTWYFSLQPHLLFYKFLDCFSLLLQLPLHSPSPGMISWICFCSQLYNIQYFPLHSNLFFCKFLDCFSLLLRLPLHSTSPKMISWIVTQVSACEYTVHGFSLYSHTCYSISSYMVLLHCSCNFHCTQQVLRWFTE